MINFPFLEVIETNWFYLTLHDGGRYHIEICSANQWTGFYMITAFVMKELIFFKIICKIMKQPELLIDKKVSAKISFQSNDK